MRGEEPQIKTDKMVNKLTENIGVYLQQENISKTEDLKAGISKLITEIEAEYKEAVSLPFVDYFNDYKIQYNKIILIILPIVILFTGLLCYLLLRIHRYQHRGLRYIVYALMAASLLITLVSSFLLITKKYEDIMISPDYYKNFLQELLIWSTRIFLYMGGIGLTIVIGLISLVTYLKAGIENR